MKKVFAVLCIMVMGLAFALTGCGGSGGGEGTAPSEDSAYIGSWIATDAEFGDDEMQMSDVLEEGDYIVTLNADGTGVASYGGEDSEGTWKETKNGCRLDGDSLHMDFIDEGDGTISCNIFGFKMFFKKQ